MCALSVLSSLHPAVHLFGTGGMITLELSAVRVDAAYTRRARRPRVALSLSVCTLAWSGAGGRWQGCTTRRRALSLSILQRGERCAAGRLCAVKLCGAPEHLALGP
eukprot:3998568-Prymnesium_polylepis.2